MGQYYCPMHPDYHSDRPGDCPICGMRLVPVEKKQQEKPAPSAQAQATGRKILFYRNPMSPAITSPVPAKDEMGMDYVPVYADELKGPAPGAVPEHAPIEVAGEGVRLAGVQTAVAARRPLTRTTRAAGVVTPDETRLARATSKN